MNYINLKIFRARLDDPKSEWLFDINIDGKKTHHERCERTYAVAGDAITSARHAVNELQKGAKP